MSCYSFKHLINQLKSQTLLPSHDLPITFQVKSWFANKRNRTNNTKPKVQVRAMEEKLKEVCQDLQQKDKTNNTHIIQKLSEVIQMNKHD